MKKLSLNFHFVLVEGKNHSYRVYPSYDAPRDGYAFTHREIKNTRELLATLRNGQYTFPGCYPLYFVTSDGGALLFSTVIDNLKSVLSSTRNRSNDGWWVIGCDINYEDDDLYDSHTNEKIECAYPEDSEEDNEE